MNGTYETPNTTLKHVVVKDGVTRIGDNAFMHCTNMESIVIPPSVKTIGKLAFKGCKALRNIILPPSIEIIGNDAFAECAALESIALPDGVKTVADHAFADCASLQSVVLPRALLFIGKYAFFKCVVLASIVMPPSVTEVGDWAFFECLQLVTVGLPYKLTTLGSNAFKNCAALTSVTLPPSLVSIGMQAFSHCTALSHVTIPSSVQTIGKSAFKECSLLKALLKVSPEWPQTTILNKTNLPESIDARRAAAGEKWGGGGVYAMWGVKGKRSNSLDAAYQVAAFLGSNATLKALIKTVEEATVHTQKALLADSRSSSRNVLLDDSRSSGFSDSRGSFSDVLGSETDNRDSLLQCVTGPSVPVIVRLELACISVMANKPGFVPPQLQPRALRLKLASRPLQEAMFPEAEGSSSTTTVSYATSLTMDADIHRLIEHYFLPVARSHFAECVEQSRGCVDEMQSACNEVRKGHLLIYSDTLQQIRQEPTFPELLRRSNKLVADSQDLVGMSMLTQGLRPFFQSTNTVCGLFRGAMAISPRYNALMETIAFKTNSVFHKAAPKGILRICEKLALTPAPHNWEPKRVTDVIRGAIECTNFTTMLNVLRLLCDLDGDERIKVTGETGGIADRIFITRCKGRFGHPTSGGWADIMMNLCFQDDESQHICELQLMHTQLYTVRKNMGAHKSYSIFRAALELCEMVGADPEAKSDPKELEALIWRGEGSLVVKGQASLAYVSDWKAEAEQLRAKVATLETQVENSPLFLDALSFERNRVTSLKEKVAALEVEMAKRAVSEKERVASLEGKVATLEVEVAKMAKLEANMAEVIEYLQLFGPKVTKSKKTKSFF